MKREKRSLSEEPENYTSPKNKIANKFQYFHSKQIRGKGGNSEKQTLLLRNLQEERYQYRSRSGSRSRQCNEHHSRDSDTNNQTDDSINFRKMKEMETQWEIIKQTIYMGVESTPNAEKKTSTSLTTSSGEQTEGKSSSPGGIKNRCFNSLAQLQVSLGKLRSVSAHDTSLINSTASLSRKIEDNQMSRISTQRKSSHIITPSEGGDTLVNVVTPFGHKAQLSFSMNHSENSGLLDNSQDEISPDNLTNVEPLYRKKIYVPHKIINLGGSGSGTVLRESRHSPNLTKLIAPKYKQMGVIQHEVAPQKKKCIMSIIEKVQRDLSIPRERSTTAKGLQEKERNQNLIEPATSNKGDNEEPEDPDDTTTTTTTTSHHQAITSKRQLALLINQSLKGRNPSCPPSVSLHGRSIGSNELLAGDLRHSHLEGGPAPNSNSSIRRSSELKLGGKVSTSNIISEELKYMKEHNCINQHQYDNLFKQNISSNMIAETPKKIHIQLMVNNRKQGVHHHLPASTYQKSQTLITPVKKRGKSRNATPESFKKSQGATQNLGSRRLSDDTNMDIYNTRKSGSRITEGSKQGVSIKNKYKGNNNHKIGFFLRKKLKVGHKEKKSADLSRSSTPKAKDQIGGEKHKLKTHNAQMDWHRKMHLHTPSPLRSSGFPIEKGIYSKQKAILKKEKVITTAYDNSNYPRNKFSSNSDKLTVEQNVINDKSKKKENDTNLYTKIAKNHLSKESEKDKLSGVHQFSNRKNSDDNLLLNKMHLRQIEEYLKSRIKKKSTTDVSSYSTKKKENENVSNNQFVPKYGKSETKKRRTSPPVLPKRDEVSSNFSMFIYFIYIQHNTKNLGENNYIM